ncbi:MAG: hypothetical protein JW395_3723 [Nitrospira sp.]|nr:hypothetical protein [Nitrospira sp.]
MRQRIPPLFLVLATFTLLSGCSDDSTSSTELPDCTGEVTITVSAGTTPQFSWAPACQLFFLIVEPAASGEDLWSIGTEGANEISPSVRYGTVPPGAQELDPPTPLMAGTEYKVAIFRYTGPGRQDGVIIGLQTFTP